MVLMRRNRPSLPNGDLQFKRTHRRLKRRGGEAGFGGRGVVGTAKRARPQIRRSRRTQPGRRGDHL